MKNIKQFLIKKSNSNLSKYNFKNSKVTFLAFFISFFYFSDTNLKGQTFYLFDTTNTKISNKVLHYDIPGEILYIKCDSLLKGEIFTTFRNYTGLVQSDTMVVNREWQSDASDIIITEYLRYRNGLLVEYSDFKEHSLNGYTLFLNGNINKYLPSDYIPLIDSNYAIDLVSNDAITTYQYSLIETTFLESDTLFDTTYLNHTTTLAWGNETLEYYLSLDFDPENGIGSFEPTSELVYGRFYHEDDSIYYRLSWKISIATVNHDSSYNEFTYYVDAITSEILYKKKEDGRGGIGTFNHLYYGQRNIQYSWVGNTNKYVLHATDQKNVKTHTIKTLPSWSFLTHQWEPYRLPNNSSSNWGNNYWDATAAHYSATSGLDYFRTFHNAIFPGEIRIITDADDQFGATWRVGTRNGWDWINVGQLHNIYYGQVDVLTHELTHAFINRIGKIPYSPEGWTIEEAFCDMFGLNANRWANPSQWSWEFPAHGGFPIRNMADPTLIPTSRSNEIDTPCNLPTEYPTIYKGSNWYFDNGIDDCAEKGIYINMTVLTKWYFLLEQGGSQNGYLVNGIGEIKARNLIWHTLKNYAGSNINFHTLRAKTLASAAELFGVCLTEYQEVCNAFNAIGVYGSCCDISLLPMPACYNFTSSSNMFHDLSTDKIEDIDKSLIYPNPFENSINITFDSVKENIHIIAYDMQGKKVFNHKYADKIEIKIDLNHLDKGLYHFKVETNGASRIYKLLKI